MKILLVGAGSLGLGMAQPRLDRDRGTLRLMCMAVSEGFRSLRGHARHATTEMHALSADVLEGVGEDDGVARLRELLDPNRRSTRPAAWPLP